MTIDTAIKKYRKLSNSDRTCYPEEAAQIAEWLEELKMYKSLAPRELISQKQRNDRNAEYHKGFNDGYNKAIDAFVDILLAERTQCYNFDDSEHNNPIKCVWWNDIEGIAEQLKAGGADANNE